MVHIRQFPHRSWVVEERIKELRSIGKTPYEIAEELGLPHNSFGLEWTRKENDYLKENYKTKSDTEIGKILGRSTESVCGRRTELGLLHPIGIKFTKEEIEKLKRLYPILTWEELQKEFPKRTPSSIRSVAENYHLKRGDIRFWSKEEIEILRKFYKSASWKDIKSALPKRNKSAIDGKASSLKLKREYNWSNEDIEKLKKSFETLDWESLMKMFPERTKVSIIGKAEKLHLHCPNRRWKRKWSDEEDKILKEFYPKLSMEELLVKFPNRNRSQIVTRASIKKIRKEQLKIVHHNQSFYASNKMQKFLATKPNISAYIQGLIEADMRKTETI